MVDHLVKTYEDFSFSWPRSVLMDPALPERECHLSMRSRGVAYRELLLEQRRLLHAKVVDVMDGPSRIVSWSARSRVPATPCSAKYGRGRRLPARGRYEGLNP